MEGYLSSVVSAIRSGDGDSLKNLFALPVPKLEMDAFAGQLSGKSVEALENECRSQLSGLDGHLSAVVVARLAALGALSAGNYDEAYKHIHSAYNGIVDYISGPGSGSSGFLTSAFVQVVGDLRQVACIADRAKPQRERLSNPCLRESQNSITRGFTLVKKDRKPLEDPNSRKRTIFAVTNVLFKIYFKLNTLQLCGKLINLVETRDTMDNLTMFPVSDVVMYKYYVGRLKMFEDRYEDARECFRFSLKHCPQRCTHNRRLILSSLVPIEMVLGVMPTQKVADLYNLHILVELGQAVKKGDLRAFNTIVATNRANFIHQGIYLVVEQLKAIVFRNLFKRIHKITESTRLSVVTFQSVLKMLGEDMELDEIECILSNLIFKNIVKGYLSHQKRIMVIGKSDPFPTTSIVKKQKI